MHLPSTRRNNSASHETARKAIYNYYCGMVPQAAKRGHGRNGLGAIKDLSTIHHAFIYQCYLKHPEHSKLSYTRMLYGEFKMTISETFISLWFKRLVRSRGIWDSRQNFHRQNILGKPPSFCIFKFQEKENCICWWEAFQRYWYLFFGQKRSFHWSCSLYPLWCQCKE